MTTCFAFRLADATQHTVDELLSNLEAGVSAPQHELHTRVSLIGKGNHAALNPLIPQLRQGELKVMVDYFSTLLVEG